MLYADVANTYEYEYKCKQVGNSSCSACVICVINKKCVFITLNRKYKNY